MCYIDRFLTLAGPCIIIQFKYINQADATVLQTYYLRFYVAQHVSGVSTPSSGAYNCINSFWFYLGALVVAALLVVGQTTTNNAATFIVQQQIQSLLTFRRLMSYIYGAPILDVSRSHTTTQHSR